MKFRLIIAVLLLPLSGLCSDWLWDGTSWTTNTATGWLWTGSGWTHDTNIGKAWNGNGWTQCTICGGGSSGNGLLNNLLAYHAMEEASGLNRLDSTANGLDLTNAGLMNLTLTHIEGTAAARPANGSSVLTNGSASYNITGSFTEMLWFRTSGTLDGLQIIGRCCDVNAWEVGFGSSGSIPFFVRNAANSGYITVTSTTNMNNFLNKWAVLVVGYDSTGQSNFIRINKERKQLIQNTDGIRNVASSLIVGGQSGPITGTTPLIMDVHASWTRALSDTDIDTIINGYDFDAQSGTPLWLSGWQN